jgi:hypothetical protein
LADRRSRDSQLLVSIVWTGAVLVALGIVGYVVEPRFYFVWLILVIFGVASVPQGIAIALKEQRNRYRLRGR